MIALLNLLSSWIKESWYSYQEISPKRFTAQTSPATCLDHNLLRLNLREYTTQICKSISQEIREVKRLNVAHRWLTGSWNWTQDFWLSQARALLFHYMLPPICNLKVQVISKDQSPGGLSSLWITEVGSRLRGAHSGPLSP